MKTIEMNIAIIPNRGYRINLKDEKHSLISDMYKKKIDGYNNRWGLDLHHGDVIAEIWYGSEEESYQNGGLPKEFDQLFPAEGIVNERGYQFDKYGNRLDILPMFLPARMFEGLKEGDRVLLFKSSQCEVYGILAQLKNRYHGFGNFETVLEDCTKWSK